MSQRRIKRPKRQLRVHGQETAAERQTRTAVQFIMGSPYYAQILKAIRSGAPNGKIAEWGIERGWFDQNQKTVTGYLQYFRKAQPQICKPQPNQDFEYTGGGIASYDHLFDGNAAIVDEETELLKLIQLQKARIGMAFNNERQMRILLQSNRKEIEELRNLLMDLAKLRGLIGNTMEINMHSYSEGVQADLKGLQHEERQRNVIATLVSDLAGVVSHG